MVYAIYDCDSDNYNVKPNVDELPFLDIGELYNFKTQKAKDNIYWRNFKAEWIVENKSFRLINENNELTHAIYCAEEKEFKSEYSRTMKEYKKRIVDYLQLIN